MPTCLPRQAKPKPTPGPGDVDVPDLWGHAGQAYTFGGKSTEKAPKEGQPGPGNYNVRRQYVAAPIGMPSSAWPMAACTPSCIMWCGHVGGWCQFTMTTIFLGEYEIG